MPHTVIRLLQSLLLALALASPATRTAAGVEDEINQAEERRYAAMIAGDMDSVADLLADEFIFNQPSGTIATKASLLEQLKSGEVKVYKVQRYDVTIHVYGTTASDGIHAPRSGNKGRAARGATALLGSMGVP